MMSLHRLALWIAALALCAAAVSYIGAALVWLR